MARGDGGKIVFENDDVAMLAIRRGWYLGKETFKDQLLELFEKTPRKTPSGRSCTGGEVRDHAAKDAARLVALKVLGAPSGQAALAGLPKCDERKIILAGILRETTCVSNDWIASRLVMGHPGSVSRLLSAGRTDKYLSMKRRELAEILFPEKKAHPRIPAM